MQKPSKRQRRILEKVTATYQTALPTRGTSYLSERGITDPALIEGLRFGVVDSPEPGHEKFANRLTIPYMDMLGVCGMKFRCMIPHDCKAENCPKYLALDGYELTLYNLVDADSTRDTIH